METDLLDVAKECRELIVSIAKSWARIGMANNRYGNLTDDFFEHLLEFAKAAELKRMVTLTQQINVEIAALLATFTPEQQGVITERLEGSKERINEDVDDPNFHGLGMYCTTSILQRISRAANERGSRAANE